MSVIVSNRKLSRLEVITYSVEVHKLIVDLMQRSFGVRDVDQFVRVRYAYGKEDKEDFGKYRYLMHCFKVQLNKYGDNLTANVRAANSIHPTRMAEYDQRRLYQDSAIVNCEQIKMELQKVADIFNVDINRFAPLVKAVNRETDLIKKWRQSDNKIKSRLQG